MSIILTQSADAVFGRVFARLHAHFPMLAQLFGMRLKDGVDLRRNKFFYLTAASADKVLRVQNTVQFIPYCAEHFVLFDKLDEILGFKAKNERSVVGIALGYRAENDSNASRPKSRLPRKRVIEFLR